LEASAIFPILVDMRRLTIVFFYCFNILLVRAQSLENKVTDAFVITRMIEKFHVEPRPLDRAMSAALYGQLLRSLDDERLFFTQADIAKLSVYQYKLDEEIRGRKMDFLQLLTGIFQQRLQETDTMVEHLTAKPFTFTAKEILTAAEDSSYPADLNARRTKVYKTFKYHVASRIAVAIAAQEELKQPGGRTRQQLIDSLEPKLRKRVMVSTKRMIKRLLQSPTGIGNMIGISYCQALATCYDPHTDYFSPDEKAQFETEIGNKPLSYGLTLTQNEDGHAEVGRLTPGGPAFQSGKLSEGDRIVAVRWDGKEPIDVADATAEELYHILSSEGADRLILGVKKADGTTHEVSLQKARVATSTADDEDDKVQGFLLKGEKTVGYISLPAFYEDWEDSKGVNGCANDVAKEIIKLKKENIGGLILDLRYNGGGSMAEAVQLSGLFIDAGPVGQIISRDSKVITLKDINRGTVWSGPLLVLVNGSSASASEMVAGTLQDYHRALIVGSPTYGKATAQVVLPMDTTTDLEHFDANAKASSYLKVTISKLYRVNGTTAQMSGVKPDVTLPDPLGSATQRESDEAFVLKPTPIAANKYYQPLPVLPVADEQAIAEKAMSGNAFFRMVRAGNVLEKRGPRDYSLLLDELLAEAKKGTKENKEPEDMKNELFTVGMPAYEQAASDERKKDVLYDPYLQVAYQLAAGMIK
jgi:carboxyl-terminal processing protease